MLEVQRYGLIASKIAKSVEVILFTHMTGLTAFAAIEAKKVLRKP
jgi:hypothetical protein